MNADLSSKFSTTFLETEGGGYYNWMATDFPVLGEAKVAAGKLVLKPRGFALPHYADCSKIGYVLEGKCRVGFTTTTTTTTNAQEMAYIDLKKGDIIPVPLPSVSWWYNYGQSDLVMIFLGETTKAYVAGEITYFVLTGALGHLAAFSPESIAKTYQINVDKVEQLVGSQKGALIIKLSEEEAKNIPNPNPNPNLGHIWTKNIIDSCPDVEVKNGGRSTTLNGVKFPYLEEVGLNVSRLVLEPDATRAPSYASDPREFYVVKGSGKVEIVGLQGNLALNTKVEVGQLFVVPKLFMVTMSADEEGMELISIVTSPRAMTGELGSKNSVLNTISSILQVSLNVTPELSQRFKQMIENGAVIVPPMSLGQS